MAAFGAAALLVATIGTISWKISQDAVAGALSLAHTHEVLTGLADAKGYSFLIELSTQNYRVSGDPARLAERDTAIAARDAVLRRIEALTADHGDLQARLKQAGQLIAERLAISQRVELLRRTEGAEAANAYVAGAPLKETRERLFRLLGEMEAEEHRLLAERQALRARQHTKETMAALASALAAMLLLAGNFVLIRRQMQATESRRRQLQAANERIRAIFDAIGEGLHGLDANGNIVFENPAAVALLGWDLHELIGKHAHSVIHHTRADGADYPVKECPIYATLRDGQARRVEDDMFWRKDGTGFPVAYTSAAMRDTAGKVTGVVVSFRDITEQKQAGDQLVAARKAEELANRAKDSFLATMSHEIRTPLGGLLGMLELLSLSRLDADQADVLQSARESGRSLLRILNDILDWSKIEDGKLELAPQATSIAALATTVLNTYARVASARSVILESRIDARLGPAHRVDPLRLSQVLNNFVSNAIKFSQVGGRVELRVEQLARHADAEEIRFSVQDWGIGIDPEQQQRLFQDYGQASADTARMYGGTGLGLSICRRLAELMQGSIELDSAPGRGSTISLTLTLPIAAAAVDSGSDQGETDSAAFAPPLVAGAAAADAPRVLVVDDHPINRKLLALQLGQIGLRAETAENGAAALALWREGRETRRHALVITDCHMPVLDGYQLCRAIRADEAADGRPRTPVLAWTANALADEREKCRAAGMDELLVKPVDMARLKATLAAWLPGAVSPSSSPFQGEAVSPSSSPFKGEVRRGMGSVAASFVPIPSPALQSQTSHATFPLKGREAPTSPDAVAPAPTLATLDVRVLAALVGDDPAIIRDFLLDFRAGATAIADELSAACANGKMQQVEALAHKLKSSARSVGALALGELCAELEAAGKAGRSTALPHAWLRFTTEIDAVDAALAELTAPRDTPDREAPR